MRWIMRKEFEIAYIKAQEVLDKMHYSNKEMIRTSSVIDTVEEILNLDVKFSDYDFKKFNNKKLDFSNYGAAMAVFKNDEATSVSILLNERESPKMKRFSLVHELGHLMTNYEECAKDFQISTHIDMDITSIPNEVLNDNEFLIKEQVANIFALLVLIPFEMLIDATKRFGSLNEVSDFLGVENSAVISRLRLEDAQKLINAK